jgi:proteasome alpha subunit
LLEYKATGIGAGRSAVMEVFEEKYREDLEMDEAVLLGLEALYKAAEGKVEAATTEIGIIKLCDRKFYKLTEKEVAAYVERMKANVAVDKGEKGEKGEA